MVVWPPADSGIGSRHGEIIGTVIDHPGDRIAATVPLVGHGVELGATTTPARPSSFL